MNVEQSFRTPQWRWTVRRGCAIALAGIMASLGAGGALAAPGGPELGSTPPIPACINVLVVDSDGDLLSDCAEVNYHHTDPYNFDTDGDSNGTGGSYDGREVNQLGTDPLVPDPNADGDGWIDAAELWLNQFVLPDYPDGSCVADPNDPDSDDDGLLDGYDGGGVKGYCYWDRSDLDSDRDGLTDGFEEFHLGTNPHDADSDDDGFTDGAEVSAGTDPLNPRSHPRTRT